jgi:peptide deformylase
MAVRKVLKMGDPRLLQVAKRVDEFNTPELDALIQDMLDTMAAYTGAGLAAPQIGVSKRVIIFGVEANPRYPEVEPVPTTIVINPHLEPLSNEVDEAWEGCLSVPGMRGLVPRYTRLRYQGFDRHGTKFVRDVNGFHARVVQHEHDHLNGILYPRRIRNMINFGFEDELFKQQEEEE